VKKLVSLLTVLALMLSLASLPAAADALPADGVYTGTGTGMHSDIQVRVTVAEGRIANVEILAQDETPGISDPAFATLPQRIIDAQSADVDVVTTATFTSNGIIAAVKNALAGEVKETAEQEFTPDFIIVGGGMAGMCGAIRGTELGLKVLLIEGAARIGGSLLYAGGTLSGAGFKIQKENGVEDTPEAFYEDIIAIGGIDNLNAPLARAHAEKSAAAVDWMDEDIGADFGSRSLFGGWYAQFETLRVTLALDNPNLGGGKGFLDPMLKRIDAAVADGSLKILLNTTVTELMTENGKCVGVKAGDTVYTAPAYLLATGGYSHNLELLKMAGFEDAVSAGPSTSNGSGYLMAKAIGGVLDNMDNSYSYHGGGMKTNGFDMQYRLNTSYPGLIYVDQTGARIGDETTGSLDLWKKASGSKLYAVIGAETTDKSAMFIRVATSAYTPLENNGWDKLEELAAEGNCVYKADTLKELAEKIGAPELVNTVEKYNADCKAGEDTLFNRKADSMKALENGPFYAVATVPYAYTASTGGVRANAEGQLALEDGSAIENLYLAGEIMGPTNISGSVTFGGLDHALCVIWGKNAAEAAQKIAGK